MKIIDYLLTMSDRNNTEQASKEHQKPFDHKLNNTKTICHHYFGHERISFWIRAIGETEYVCTKVHFKRFKLEEMDFTYSSSSIAVQIQTNI
jgi:hypothetical protein